MAKKTTKKTTKKAASKKATSKKTSGRRAPASRSKQTYKAGDAKGKQLDIVESPSKAKTINR